ncbi:alpha-glucosidase [Halomicroarcula sp. S1AR25-4]|uniref:glycoside hydrolase family 13 protein n=1 Tax=Haloarcula sp. S1AR25-4 TaxID=2950538 RepID=UPI0028747A5E|nr:alpha-glucosidase [Halomicroarcula sp. S1AR25-4]MDS0279730.1 alpha-glucosidase [Halomicroarcula sp. S1AR25-4]
MTRRSVTATTDRDRQWWKEAVVYQVYPRSFYDSDGDGVGDLPGVTAKVEYLDDLGVDVVWLCPVYESPNADNGYDISDYRAIMDEFGTMADWETLLDALHEREMRLLMDLVVNHTSDEHEWFQRSRRREDGYEDYYYWRDGSPDEPPNNWGSFMGGSAWTYDEVREQWYLHLFDEKQPDLNWRNADVRDEIASLVEWWLEKGIDGFRIDASNYISKPEGLPDGASGRSPTGVEQFSHGPRVHEYLRELYERTFSNYDVMTVAEMNDTSVELAREYLGESGDGLDMIVHFEHMGVDAGPGGRWDPEGWGEWSLPAFKEIMSRWQRDLGDGWNAPYLGNHDQPRIVSRFGDDGEYRTESAKLLATFLLTSRGTPFVYQGEEIGMTNAEFDGLADLDDPQTVGAIEDLLAAGTVDSYAEVREFVNYVSRDHARTPMQWDDTENAGFTDGDPWFAVNDDYTEVNVADAIADEDSIWHYYRRLIDRRHDADVLVYGDYDLLCPDDEQLYAYTRTRDDEAVLVVLNWSADPAAFEPEDIDVSASSVLISNYDDASARGVRRDYRPYEAVVVEL